MMRCRIFDFGCRIAGSDVLEAPSCAPAAAQSVSSNPKSHIRNPRFQRRRAAGLSLIELLVSLAITAALLTATMVAIDASFQAYAAAAETASTQTSTRLVTHRLMTLLRTSTAHGPLQPSADTTWPVTLTGDLLESKYLELVDSQGNFIRIEYRDADDELWVEVTPFGSATTDVQPLLGGVTDATFFAKRRFDESGVLVLERASVDLTVTSEAGNTLAIEGDDLPPIRVVASTMPRKLD